MSITETIELTPELAFVLFQAFFLSLLFLLGILTSMNNNRDYIRAIDKYVSETYGISTLFYQGEISHKHINRFNSKFSVITTLGAASMAVCIAVLVIANFNFIHKIIYNNLAFSIIVIIEVLCVLLIVGKNTKYKIDGKSKFYDDSLQYLRNAGIENISKVEESLTAQTSRSPKSNKQKMSKASRRKIVKS